MSDTAPQMIFQASILTKLLYTSGAWWGSATSDDRQRIEGFIRRCSRAGLRSSDQPSASKLVADAHDKLFYCMLYNNNHVLHYLLPDRCDTSTYNLRKHAHDCFLPNKNGHSSECTFLIRVLFKDVY